MLKVLINALSARTGGLETFLVNLLPFLVQGSPQIHASLLIPRSRFDLYSKLSDVMDIKAVPDSVINSWLKRLIFEHYTVPAMHLHHAFDVYFQVDEMLSPSIALMGVPALTVFHTTPMVLFDNQAGDGWLFNLYALSIRRWAAHHATIPVTVSHHAKAEFSGLFPKSRERFSVVYHGVDQSLFCPGVQRSNPLLKWGVTGPYLLSISNRFAWKNYYRLIQAYHILVSRRKIEYDLVLVGGAKLKTEEQRINQYIEENDLAGRVHLVDYVAQVELPDVYRGARAYIFPSLRETFGMTVLEAMACGVPVACARWGPLPEVAGNAACFFDPLDIDSIAGAIYSVGMDDMLRDDFSRKGLEHSKSFSWESAAQKYRSLLLKAVQSS